MEIKINYILPFQFHRQLIDLGGQDEVVLKQGVDRVGPKLDRHIAITGQM